MMDTLRICEIFHSIQGESSFSGQPCVFVRMSGCNLRCRWCDTTYAYQDGSPWTLDDILSRVADFQCPLVELTGGEPMMQRASACRLMTQLLEREYCVLIETNGSLPLDDVPRGVHRIIDLKPPGSHVPHDSALWSQFAKSWRDEDEIKCVVSSRDDFDWCVDKLKTYDAMGRVIVHFSPVWGELSMPDLARWICQSRLPIRFNLQIQKVIWDPAARGV